ncbi:histidinol-phosphate transaminase [Cytobacillus sp. S13-E01]|uniref:histidinol-phosphate transaminase n=1 Tax=Cytobacillus sp. S13-E01 TaxID=3031326 RepID=UPI0023D8C886|nr:histidinol-phosphate transaminase [Cytobacillus sp. S13-E01]MDF0726233.1 histidinol-phosphate transaminase [Cytobacillus sp. S13-E01]
MKIKEQLKNLKPYQPGKPIEEVKRQYGLDKITKLASNENPFGFSKQAKIAIQNSIESLAIYPDGYAADLREKFAGHLEVSPKQIIFGNGSDEILQIICRSLLSPGKNTVMATPTFPQYRHNAIIEGADCREVELIDGYHDLEGMLAQIDKETAVVWLCSPNNPTGTYIKENNLLAFLNQVPSEVLVVVDEAYYEYTQVDDYPETIKLIDQFPNLIVLRTFSKAYGLAGLRIGYGIAQSSLITQIEPAREPFNTSKMAQVAALAALDDQQFIIECAKKNKQGLEQYYTFCNEQGLFYYPSEGNFILIDFNRPGDEVFQYLLERGYIVRSGNALGFPTSVRITVGTKEQNEGIISILTEMLVEKVAN